MEAFPGAREGRALRDDEADWFYEKVDGRWQHVQRRKPGLFSPAGYKESEENSRNFLQMMRETEEQWKLNDPNIEHNEGILRDHPRYHELFEKWAMRYLRMKGFGPDVYTGIDQDWGELLGPNGEKLGKLVVNEVRDGREWIDENIEMELRISEGFVDITNDEKRQKELGIKPELHDWWTEDEI